MAADDSFVMVPRDVLYNTRLSAHARLVWIVLQSHANGEGECWPSQDRLAELTGLSKPTVRHCLDCLVAAGLLERRHSAHANHYAVHKKDSYPCEDATGKKVSPVPTVTGKKASPEAEQRKESFLPEENILPLHRKDSFPEVEPENETHRTRPTTPPEELGEFDRILRGVSGYVPTPEFYAKVLERYRDLDLVEEAIKMAGWVPDPTRNKHKRTANSAFILNWLKGARSGSPAGEYRNGTSVATKPRNADTARLYELYGE